MKGAIGYIAIYTAGLLIAILTGLVRPGTMDVWLFWTGSFVGAVGMMTTAALNQSKAT